MNLIPVTDLERPELLIYSGLSEPQLYHYHEPEPGLFIAESPMIIRRALDAGYEPVSCLVEENATLAPSARKPLTIAVPIPPVPPVTNTTLSFSLRSIFTPFSTLL